MLLSLVLPLGFFFWIIWVICACLAGELAKSKGYNFFIFAILGLFTSIIGLIIVLLLPNKLIDSDDALHNADTLLKYKELLDKQIITQEEFNKLKSKLMN